ncbi:hypothetical protein WJ07_12495 [Burkholderia vietnamiensis]|uniref:ESPR-type extended signal peptide-containing protein n=2 Tax=Burkholderia vietnamiensis TaxID=60552 RepID=UPI00075458AC|nr:ESPR-type extended signal peptide-containing protein [Burkholderia vietnamiensis]KVF25132.1 hypothetical protein WJ07_12495 [Burkholderia vietnamiensis]
MNKTYKTVWNDALGGWVAVSELACAHAGGARGTSASAARPAPRLTRLAVSLALASGLGLAGSAAWAGTVVNCVGNGITWGSAAGGTGAGAWNQFTAPQGTETACGSSDLGVALSESDTGAGGLTGTAAYVQVGAVGGNAAGTITLYGPNGIYLKGVTSLNNNKITDLAAGTVSATSTDAVNGAQLYSLSTALTGGISPDSLSTSLSVALGGITSLSTGLSSTDSTVSSLSSSVGQSVGSLSTGLLSTTTTVASLSTGFANAAVYDNAQHTSITLGGVGTGAGPVKLTNVADGVNATDAVNFRQLTSLSTTATADLSTAQTGISSLSTSLGSSVTSLSTGLLTAQSGITSLSTGLSSLDTSLASLSTAVPHYVSVKGDGTTTQGNYANDGATGTNSIAIGPNAVASATGATALGYNATASDANAVALGANSATRVATAVSSATVGGVTYDQFAGATPGGVVSVGNANLTRQIINVAAGQVTASSTDAINGSQLFAVANEVAALSTALATTNGTVSSLSTAVGNGGGGGGGGSGGGTTGGNTENTATGNGSSASGNGSSSYGSNSSASGNNSTAIGSNSTASGDGSTAVGSGAIASGTSSKADGYRATASGNNSTALGANSTASGANSVALGAGSVAYEANTVSIGSAGNERRLTNVAPGINGTDAANVNQLRAVQSSIGDVARKAYSGVAAATALTMIPEVDPGKTIAVGVGGAGFQGYGASALGVNVRLTENIKAKAGVGISAAGQAYGGGMSYQW